MHGRQKSFLWPSLKNWNNLKDWKRNISFGASYAAWKDIRDLKFRKFFATSFTFFSVLSLTLREC